MADKVSSNGEPFVAIPKDILNQIQDKSAFMLYYVIKWHANYQNGYAYPSYKRIQDMTGMGRSTIKRALDILIKSELIEVKTDKSKPSNEYIVNWSGRDLEGSHETGLVTKQESDSPETGLDPVTKQDSNKNNIIINNNDNNIEGKPSSPHFEDLTLKQFTSKMKKDSALAKRWIDSVIPKYKDDYPREFLAYYYKQVTFEDETTGLNMINDKFKKDGKYSVGRTLPNWYKNWKPREEKETVQDSYKRIIENRRPRVDLTIGQPKEIEVLND